MSYSVTHTFQGNVRRDPFGRIVVDECPSDKAHLRDSVALPGDDRARCRRLVESVLEEHIGQKGKLSISVVFQPEEDGTSTT